MAPVLSRFAAQSSARTTWAYTDLDGKSEQGTKRELTGKNQGLCSPEQGFGRINTKGGNHAFAPSVAAMYPATMARTVPIPSAHRGTNPNAEARGPR